MNGRSFAQQNSILNTACGVETPTGEWNSSIFDVPRTFLDISGNPVDIYGNSVDIYGNPVDIYGNSVDIYGNSVDIYGNPVDISGNPVDIYGNSVDVYGNPVDVYGNPVDVYGNPVDVYGMPITVGGSLPRALPALPRIRSLPPYKGIGLRNRVANLQPAGSLKPLRKTPCLYPAKGERRTVQIICGPLRLHGAEGRDLRSPEGEPLP
jgi:hypothetical protein